MNKVLDLLTHQKTAALSIGAAVLLAAADGLKHGHVDWAMVAAAGLTALAGCAKSALVK